MESLLNLTKFTNEISKKVSIDDDEILLRKLLNIASKKISDLKDSDLEFIEKVPARIYIKANKELNKIISEMNIVSDMVLFEYAVENVISTESYISDDEVY